MVRAGRHEEALTVFARTSEDPASRIQALGHHAWLLRSLGRYEESLAVYDRLVAESGTADARVSRADVWRLSGEAQRALGEALDVLRGNPTCPEAARLLCDCQRQLGASAPEPDLSMHIEQGMPSRPLNPVIEKLESDTTGFPVCSFPEVGRFLYAFVRSVRPALVIETGCFVGYSSLCIAQGLEDNGHGHLHSFDLFIDRPGYVSPVIGPAGDAFAAARAHVEQAGLSHRVTLHKGNSGEQVPRVLDELAAPVDLAYLDGDHSIKGCYMDWNAVEPHLAERAFVLLHDTDPDKCGWMGPRAVFEAAVASTAEDYDGIMVPTPQGQGLAILQRKSTAAGSGKWRPTVADLGAEWFFARRQYQRLKRKRLLEQK